MKHFCLPFLLLLAALLPFLNGCGEKPAAAGTGKPLAVCGLPPVAGLAAAVGGDRIEVKSLLPEGRTPHDYAPRPSEIREAFRGKIFFTTGMPFENNAAEALKKAMKISDITRHITRRELIEESGHHHEPDDGHHHHHHGAETLDPHVWLSPANASVIAGNIAEEFSLLDPVHEAEYRANAAALQQKLAALEKRIRTQLAPYAGRTFFVYHPSFGYFADAAKLHQRAIELSGREATPKHLAAVTREAREHQVRVIFVQEQFNPASAKALANQLQCEVVPLDPLAQDLPGNLEKITESLLRGFGDPRK